MSASKKPRKAYRPREIVPTIPLAFASSAKALTSLGLKARAAIDAVVSHQATPHDVGAVECELVVGLHMVDVSRELPALCPVEPASVEAVDSELRRITRSVRGVIERHRATGRIGCNGTERADLLELADLLDEMRSTWPRRAWFEAYRRGLKKPRLEVTA